MLKLRCLLVFALTFAQSVDAQTNLVGSWWQDVPAEDLALDAPTVDPDASVEVLFKGLDFDNSDVKYGARHSMYVRLKVFTATGVDELAQIPLRYDDKQDLGIFAARVIKPDGTIIEVARDDLFEIREEAGARRNINRQAFAPPQLAVGDIVEFRALFSGKQVNRRFFIFFQERWATRHMTVRIKSIQFQGVGVRAITHLTQREDGGVDRDGFSVYHLRDIPATTQEPLQPPVGVITPWLLYTQTMPGESPSKFWRNFSRDLFKSSDRPFTPSRRVKQEAAKLTADATTDDEKLRALFDFCHTRIINSQHDSARHLTSEQRDSIKQDDDPDEVLDRGFGNALNIRRLFAGLTRAAGFEARLARVSDRTRFYFAPSLQTDRALPASMVAVKRGEDWQFFNPGLPYYEFGRLPWKHEGVGAVIADKREAILTQTPKPDPDYSGEMRTGKFTLADDGSLAGSLILDFRGHAAVDLKIDLAKASLDQREKLVEEHLRERFPVAQFTDIEIRHLDDPDTRLEIAANLSMPSYADRLGGRLFVQPGVFEKSAQPLFTAADRVTDIVFPHGWTTEENIDLQLPTGFKLEAPSAPESHDFAPFARYEVSLQVVKAPADSLTLRYHRRLHCLGSGIAAKHYAVAKHIFDQVYQQDQHTLTIKRADDA